MFVVDFSGVQPGEGGGEVDGPLARILFESVDQPYRKRFLRPYLTHREAQIQRASPPHQGGKRPGRNREPVSGSGDAQYREWARDPQVSGDGELRPSTDRVSIYRRDYGDREPHHLLVERVQQVTHPRSLGVFEVEVRAGAERSRGGRIEDYGPGIDAIEGCVQGLDEGCVDSVQPIRPVQTEAKNVFRRPVDQQLPRLVHQVIGSPSSATSPSNARGGRNAERITPPPRTGASPKGSTPRSASSARAASRSSTSKATCCMPGPCSC